VSLIKIRRRSRPQLRSRASQHVIKRTRTGGVCVASVLFALVLALLLIFILETGQRASISYLGAHGHVPLGVALLFAAVRGILTVVVPGTARIVQLKITARICGLLRSRRTLNDRQPEPGS
jgi:uncharacterized integral membrane protein